jgi:ribonuclease HII
VPGLAVWKGDRVAACIAAASIIAKVTRDRLMCELHAEYPEYDFATHKGYCTAAHQAALDQHGPSAIHRRRWVTVARAERGRSGESAPESVPVDNEGELVEAELVQAGAAEGERDQ